MQAPSEDILDLNPDYGSGVFRRRIRFTASNGSLLIELEDCSHAMRVVLAHNGDVVTAIEGEVLRAPITSCRAAPEQLQDFIGQPLQLEESRVTPQINPAAHCTHLYDMTVLGLALGIDSPSPRQIDIAIADECEGLLDAQLQLDGHTLHHWQLRDNHIVAPSSLAGNTLSRGFNRWVTVRFEGEARLCAMALQKGVLVSFARRWNMSQVYGTPADTFGPGKNICYSYSVQRVHTATRAFDSVRDFSNTPEELLQFK